MRSIDEVVELRAQWVALSNAVLERSGYAARVDHRFLTAQGIEVRQRHSLDRWRTQRESEAHLAQPAPGAGAERLLIVSGDAETPRRQPSAQLVLGPDGQNAGR